MKRAQILILAVMMALGNLAMASSEACAFASSNTRNENVDYGWMLANSGITVQPVQIEAPAGVDL